MPNLYARVHRFSVYKGYLSKKERESKFQKRKWTPISLNDENLVLNILGLLCRWFTDSVSPSSEIVIAKAFYLESMLADHGEEE